MVDSRHELSKSSRLGGDAEANHFPPGGVPFHQQLPSSGSGRPVASYPEMVADCTE